MSPEPEESGARRTSLFFPPITVVGNSGGSVSASDRRSPSQGPAPERLAFIDSLRGFALFGVFGANLLIFAGFDYMTDRQAAALMATGFDKIAFRAERLFVETKFMGLFSFLFGISFWLFLDRVRARGRPATQLFYRRIGWLFVIGALHGWLLWCWDILRFYALWGLLLPLFLRMPLRRLLAAAFAAAVLAPAVISGIVGVLPRAPGHGVDLNALALAVFSKGTYVEALSVNWKYDWYLTLSVGQIGYQFGIFGRLLLGLYAARALDLSNLASHRKLLRRVLWVGAPVGLAGNALFAAGLLDGGRGFAIRFMRELVEQGGFLGLTLAYAAGLALLHATPGWASRVETLAPLGRMALSAYLCQTLFGVWLFYGFAPGPHWMGRVGPGALALLCVTGYAVQVWLAGAWMRRFSFGPAEWIWRAWTYWQAQPMRRVRGVNAARPHAGMPR
jgi:uncharacterized protein